MIKDILDRIKQKAIEDDNRMWESQEEWVQRKECKASLGEKMFYFSLGLAIMSMIHFIL